MDALSWEFSGQEISLHQRAESYNSHKFDVKDANKPMMLLEEGGDEYRLCLLELTHHCSPREKREIGTP